MMLYNIKNPKQPRASCVSSFQTLYGLGRSKAKKLNTILLNHPAQLTFSLSWDDLQAAENSRVIFVTIPTANKVRLFVCYKLTAKIDIFTYAMQRLFQNLPTKGRTKANAGTPSHFNPYLVLNVNGDYFQQMLPSYKRKELLSNERYDELKAFDAALIEKEKTKKTDSKVKQKTARENYIKSHK